MSRRASSSSAGVHAAKSRVRSSSAGLQRTRTCTSLSVSSSAPSASGPVSSSRPTVMVSAGAGVAGTVALGSGAQRARKGGGSTGPSSRRRRTTARPAQYRVSRCSRPTAANASPRVMVAPTGTSRPAWRSTRANATTTRSASSLAMVALAGVEEGAKPVAVGPLLVFAVLQDGAERHRDGLLVEGGRVERGDGLGPVDRLGDPRRLVQVEVAQRRDGRRDLAGEGLSDAGGPDPQDRQLPLEVGMVDPVV